MSYPRVLIVSIGRINSSDTTNNGLLLRNLFGPAWPRVNLAQIFSSGDNGDEGFFGSYYQLGPCDRTFGSLFYMFKERIVTNADIAETTGQALVSETGAQRKVKEFSKGLFIDSGLYEILFRPRLSTEMDHWVKDFQPDIIFAQGYNLTFSLLPLILKNSTGAKLAFLCSDDWPTYLYSGQHGETKLFRWLTRPSIKAAIRQLLSEVDIPFAFGQPMAEEYESRYGKSFITLNHADDSVRFDNSEPHRIYPPDVNTLLAIGTFNKFRWPLLIDISDACRELNALGTKTRLVVFSSSVDEEGKMALTTAPFIDVIPDPGNDLLPSYLKGADLLLLAEGFEESYVDAVRLSVSSKAHLFMFSRRPIIVYAHPETGIAKYAQAHGWARVVGRRDQSELVAAIQELIDDRDQAAQLVCRSDSIARQFHTHRENRDILLAGLTSVPSGNIAL